MPSEELLMTNPHFITAYVQKFRETKNILLLVKAAILVLRQQRALELIYGGYCSLFHRPSVVCPWADEAALIAILKAECAFVYQGILSKEQITRLYGGAFKVGLLPTDFQGARCESIWQNDESLIIGEYGESSRIAYVSPESCIMSDYYCRVPGVRHIHSIQGYGDAGDFLVSTGDTCKFLDLWSAGNGKVNFARRLSKHLAGFTAAVRVKGEYYFGTDFSSRPNFIETLEGTKYFFPAKAYRLYVTAFHAFLDRYIIAVNNELVIAGGRKTLSVFDTVERRFIFCEYWADEAPQLIKRAA